MRWQKGKQGKRKGDERKVRGEERRDKEEEEDTEKGGKRNRNIGMWQGVRTGKKRGHKGQLYPLFSSKIFLLLQRERVENEVSGLLSQILILI